MSISAAKVFLWGRQIGAVAWDNNRGVGTFSYTNDFLKNELEPSPIYMPASDKNNNRFSFPSLNKDTFLGLPPMLADSLPDKFGSAMIDIWLAKNGRPLGDMNPVEKLLYIGSRGMGALEFRPAAKGGIAKAEALDLGAMVNLANDIMQQKESLDVNAQDKDALAAILQVGTSAGGARPKAIVAIHKETKQIISGHTKTPEGYEHWIIKFDGVSDMELGEPQGFGRIEYAYYLMAKKANIDMSPCDLWEENGRAHFMTKRFDRDGDKKVHMQSLCGVAHYDFNMARAYSYEQAIMVAYKLGLPKADIIRLYRRMVFNVLARNQDDHTKNIAFLMGELGVWRLSPAFDVTYSHNPKGEWTNRHQMLINNKADDFTIDDLLAVAKEASITKARTIIGEVETACKEWNKYAKQAGVPRDRAEYIKSQFRTL